MWSDSTCCFRCAPIRLPMMASNYASSISAVRTVVGLVCISVSSVVMWFCWRLLNAAGPIPSYT